MCTAKCNKEETGRAEKKALPVLIRRNVHTLVRGSKVTVDSVTKVTGSFATDLFSANTTDMDVRDMLHGYSTVAITSSTYAVNESAVTLETALEDGNGNKLYQFKVKDGLCYNDGTPITAKDYVFSVLMQASPAMAELGGNTSLYWQVYGYDNYNSGKQAMLTGLRLVDDMIFGITMRSNALPNFYELMLVNVTPYPISVIAPDCQVMDDGRGAYIQGDFTAALLEKTFLDPETGYASHPMVTSGPYQLVSYDAAAGTVVMQANENYRGNYEGQRPLIETVTLVETTNVAAVDALLDGTLDIVNKLSDAQAIDAGRAQLADGKLQVSQYLCSGLGFMSFACEQGPTASENVRKAVSYCLDQESFVGWNAPSARKTLMGHFMMALEKNGKGFAAAFPRHLSVPPRIRLPCKGGGRHAGGSGAAAQLWLDARPAGAGHAHGGHGGGELRRHAGDTQHPWRAAGADGGRAACFQPGAGGGQAVPGGNHRRPAL